MKYVSSKEFSEMLKQHKQETKVAHKKKLYNKITKEVKNLSMENNDRRKILNSYQRFLKKQSGGDVFNDETKTYTDSKVYNIKAAGLQEISAYDEDINNLSIFINNPKNFPKQSEKSNYYYIKMINSFKKKEDFFPYIKATKIKNVISMDSFNTLGYLIDFLNYWMMYVQNTDDNKLTDTKQKLTDLVVELEKNGFVTENNQVPSDLDDLHYDLETMTNDKKKNLCALDNILSVLTLKKTNKAQLVNYNFIQDMEKYLSDNNIKEIVDKSKYTGTMGMYDSYMTKYINVILDNLPAKPDDTESTLIPIYTSIMKKASTLEGTKEGMFDFGTKTIANVTDIKNIPESTMVDIRAGLDNLYTACGNIQSNITTLKNKLPQTGKGAPNPNNFNANSVKALYHVFSQSALFKEPIESYYGILSNPDLIDKFIKNDGTINTKKSANGTTSLGAFVETKGADKFLSDVIFSKIAIGAYDDPALPNQLTQSAYQGWDVQGQAPPTATGVQGVSVPTGQQIQLDTVNNEDVLQLNHSLRRSQENELTELLKNKNYQGIYEFWKKIINESSINQFKKEEELQQLKKVFYVKNGKVNVAQYEKIIASQKQQQPLLKQGTNKNQGQQLETETNAMTAGLEAKVVEKVNSKFKEGQKVLNAKNKKKMYNIKNVLPDRKYKIRPASATDNKNNKVVGENNIIEVPKPPKKK